MSDPTARTPAAVGVTSLGSSTAPDGLAPGTTVIDDAVIATVAGIAARGVAGVYALGGGAARALRQVVGGTDHTQGVRVEVDGTRVAVGVTVVAEYPSPLQPVADGVRAAVSSAIVDLVGLEITAVDVAIEGLHIPGEGAAAA